MRKIILGVAVSLDGYIEGPAGEYDWCPPPDGMEMKSFLDGIDTIFMGRKSYEVSGTSMFPDKSCVVFSTTLSNVKGKNTRIVKENVLSWVKEYKSHPGSDIWLFGGASLITSFMNADLVDELWMATVPVVLGGGKPLFQDITARKWFTLGQVTAAPGYISIHMRRKLKYSKEIGGRKC